MRMEVVNRKRSMTLPDGSWHECKDKRGADKQGLHGVLRKVKSANNFGESKLEEIPMNKNSGVDVNLCKDFLGRI